MKITIEATPDELFDLKALLEQAIEGYIIDLQKAYAVPEDDCENVK